MSNPNETAWNRDRIDPKAVKIDPTKGEVKNEGGAIKKGGKVEGSESSVPEDGNVIEGPAGFKKIDTSDSKDKEEDIKVSKQDQDKANKIAEETKGFGSTIETPAGTFNTGNKYLPLETMVNSPSAVKSQLGDERKQEYYRGKLRQLIALTLDEKFVADGDRKHKLYKEIDELLSKEW